MTTDQLPITKPRLWLIIASVIAVVSTAILWPLQQVGQICIMIYPAPPGCGAEEPRWVPLVAIGLIVGLLAAAFVVYFTRPAPRTLLVILTAAMVVVLGLACAIVWLSQTGIWDPVQPYVIID
ncbi:hypothetical protein BH10ACT7_BH10ACT7_21550 [soil metagenome]